MDKIETTCGPKRGMMDHEALQQGTNWAPVLVALFGNLAAIILAVGVVIVQIRSSRKETRIQISAAQDSVNKNVGEVQESVNQNTAITKFIPEASAAKIEHKLTNGLGDHLAGKMAAAVKEDAVIAAKGVAHEVAKAEVIQQAVQVAANEIASVRASDSYSRGFADGLKEAERRATANKAAETDLMIPTPKPKDK